VWLAFSVALVRRARRLTERRLLAGIAMRRAEFESERDELRARHAVQMHRLEREVSRVLDMATAHRLEADLKERDLMAARAELLAEAEDFHDVEARLAAERANVQGLERRHAEAGSALRAAQHALKLEAKRRTAAEEALDEVSILADQRRIALAALRAENDSLRARVGEEPGIPAAFETEDGKLPRAVTARDLAADEAEDIEAEERPQLGGSVVPLPTRAKQPPPQPSPDQSVATVVGAARDLQRIADEANAPAGEPRMPAAAVPAATTGELVALRMAQDAGRTKPDETDADGTAENRFFAALAEIRALKRAANQAGE
jgi:hypothetical protein